jgi:glycosyltransferase involved in cell wall biosynthesis
VITISSETSFHCAYLINQYPKVSHAFIRREILALERQGMVVSRFAVRGWEADLVDAEDKLEHTKTRYLLQRGLLPLLLAALKQAARSPTAFLGAVRVVFTLSRKAERSFIYHLVYLAEACWLLGELRHCGAQHLHAHFGTNAATVAMLVRALDGPPYSFTVHGPEEFDKPLAIGLEAKIRDAKFVVAVSSFGRSQLFRWVGQAHWRKVRVVRCGIEPAFHQGITAPIPNTPRLVCVGRLCEQKGQLLLVEAAARLLAQGIEFQLVLAGDGDMRPQIEALISQYGLNAMVSITGWISSAQVRDEILAARAMVLPSFAEGLPVVLMEALSLRRPVISTYIAGIPELVVHGENGWLCAAGSVSELTKAMAECLAADANQLNRMGQTGYERVLMRHSIDSEAARLDSLLKANA